jgi:alpha-glucan,water dikinase
MLQEETYDAAGARLAITKDTQDNRLSVTVRVKGSCDCVLHWGLSRQPGAPWKAPPQETWPAGTVAAENRALRTPFTPVSRDESKVTIQFNSPWPRGVLSFVLHLPKENRWLKNAQKDFTITLPVTPGRAARPQDLLKSWAADGSANVQTFRLDNGDELAAAIRSTPEATRIALACEAEAPLVLHWGLVWKFPHEWALPPEACWPAGTTVQDNLAARTPFTERDGLRWLELVFRASKEQPLPRGVKFVLHQPDASLWLKQNGQEIHLPLTVQAADARVAKPTVRGLAEQIVAAEVGSSSWTLMHRFNRCHDLLPQAENDAGALALLFAWLRYSAIRQLDWQRNYNTKPRELAQAQDRLTKKLAAVWRNQRDSRRRLWPRLMLTTLGRGGEGQQVRDEILHIMHRHDLKEARGHFIEEWHQKLHNNTTPDDVVICEAYLAFLRSDGDQGVFNKTLEQGGVTRERLKSFERPIQTDPEFYEDRKDALIPEFQNFLRILKSVHAGTDLESAVDAARAWLGQPLAGKVDALLALRKGEAKPEKVAQAITDARTSLAERLAAEKDDAGLRDLLFLDLALEETLRGVIERQDLSKLSRDTAVALVRAVLDNLTLSADEPELRYCARHWAALLGQPRNGNDWALHAKSVADRASRWVQAFTDQIHKTLQPKAEFLGDAFKAERWVVPLFSEEVIRGGPVFALSRLLRYLDPILRKAAGLGGWQVISPAEAYGLVRGVDSLIAVQGERFPEATVLIADAVSGDEEIPEGVTAVLTADSPDLVSHVAVRARNAHVLFATCLEQATYDQLKGLVNKHLALHVSPGGDVQFEESHGSNDHANGRVKEATSAPSAGRRRLQPFDSRWVVTQQEFTPEIVGGKSNNLNGLRGRLPEWIRLPVSLAIPFGGFERSLQDEKNRELRGRYESLLATAENNPAEVLPKVRSLVLELAAPTELETTLRKKWEGSGLAPIPWEQTWQSIGRVWASKWNERAYLSRRARDIAHDDLLMAVLIQQVVEANYAFVIHTVNPLTGNRDEIFAEVVLGLGETLVGNYPGRALGFVCRKSDQAVQLVSYPSKSVGLYGRGVIFRSDSNGEDLEGFAGAGLYDSFLAEEPEHRTLNYSKEPLVWDGRFRDDLLRSIARIGIEVEKLLGSPQDIEGAVSGGKFYVVQTRPQVGLS